MKMMLRLKDTDHVKDVIHQVKKICKGRHLTDKKEDEIYFNYKK